MKNKLGTNAVFIELGQAMDLNLNRVEFCLGGMDSLESKAEKILRDMKKAEKNSIAYSIHLPIFLPKWYDHYFLDAFFLDPDPAKREESFKLLEFNLARLTPSASEYFVIHFPGIYDKHKYKAGTFDSILDDSLKRLNEIAKLYNTRILMEYFGSNEMFYRIEDWKREIKKHSKLGILVDTGHLFFASLMRDFDFMEGLRNLSKEADAFHLWTTKSQKAYCSNKYYVKYRHIPMCQGQKMANGWAFDTDAAMKIISSKTCPALMEASIEYGGKKYIEEGIESLKKYYF